MAPREFSLWWLSQSKKGNQEMNPGDPCTEGNAAAPVMYIALELSNKT
jgi:hypothetical protein